MLMTSQTTMLTDLLTPEDLAVESVVARYQRVAPAVTRFARTLSGDDQLVVRMGSDSAASNTEVVCDPRVFQAAYNRNAPVTPDEVAIASALHEVIHLVSTRLDELRVVPDYWPRRIAVGDEPTDLLTVMEKTAGPIAQRLFFFLEDARQEKSGLVTYPGARSVLDDLYRAALPEAFARSGSLGQFVLSGFLIAGGYIDRGDIEKRISTKALRAIDDGMDLFEAAGAAEDVWDVGEISIKLETIARSHNLATEVPKEATRAQRELAERTDAERAAKGVDAVRLYSPIVEDAESYDATRTAADARSGASDQKGSSQVADDESTDQLLRLGASPTIHLPNGQRGKLVVSPIPTAFAQYAQQGHQAIVRTARSWDVGQRRVSGELYPLFAANQRRGLRSGFDQGDVSPHAALFIGAGLYQRLYERRANRTRRTYAISLLVDGSASMLQPRFTTRGHKPWGMTAAMLGAWTMARLCDELQIDFEVALFNRGYAPHPGDTEARYIRSRSATIAGLRRTQGTSAQRLSSTVNHFLVKPFDRRWRDGSDALAGLFWTASEPRAATREASRNPDEAPPVSMFEKAANVDEFNIIHAADRLDRTGAQVKVLMVLADGMTRGSVTALSSAVRAVEARSTTVLGIGIGDDTVENAYGRHEIVDQPETLARAMVDGTRGALRRSLAAFGMETWWSRTRVRSQDNAQ
ncbi:MAG: hypothetical protein GEU79_02895 [Acidimicrobiia bacterium]|nr:hypothetical protein [Acidimicrobiia bacterium]